MKPQNVIPTQAEQPSDLTRRDMLKSMAATFAAVAANPLVSRASEAVSGKLSPAARPNILVIMTDQHLAEALSCEGHPDVHTPHLDSLAKSGIRFNRAYCQDAICGPSRFSMITGLYPRTLGHLTNGELPAVGVKYTPLPNHLSSHGYHTACFGKQHLDRTVVWNEALSVLPGETKTGYWDWILEKGLFYDFLNDWFAEFGNNIPGGNPAFNLSGNLFSRISKLPDGATMEAYVRDNTVNFLRKAKALGKPFYCQTSFYRPHQPYTPLRKYADAINPASIKLPRSFNEPAEHLPPGMAKFRLTGRTRPGNLATAHEDVKIFREFIRNYYALLHEIDDHVGDIMRTLEEEGLADNTLIFYVADHGEFCGNHGMFEKSAFDHNVYESTLRIPFFMAWKGRIRPGQVRSDLVELIDVYPTVLAAAGVPAPQDGRPQGLNLLGPAMTGNAVPRKFSVSENWSQTTIITNRHKYARWNKPPKPHAGRQNNNLPDNRSFGEMIFDRETDFDEINNLAGKAEGAQIAANLKPLLAQWESSISGEGRSINSGGVL